MSESASKSTRSTSWRNNGFFGTQPRVAAQQDTSSEGRPTAAAAAAASPRRKESDIESELTAGGFDQPSFGCQLSIAQHQADDRAERRQADELWSSKHSSAAPAESKPSKLAADSLSSLTAGAQNATHHIRQKRQQKQPKHESICAELLAMARRHYFLSLFCLSAFVGACLLGSVAISRSIGTADLDSDHSRSGRQQASLLGPPAEQFEVRSFELVDLVEHDKTFAYTKWQVKVRVPKSAPNYQQHSLAPSAIEPLAEPERRDGASAIGSEQEATRNGPEDDQYQLAGTRAFVADHMEALASGGGHSEAQNSRASAQLEAASASELDDPILMAAAELQVDSKSVNSTLLDCFMVDLDKRYGQKVALETQHRQVASTRRVSLKRMLEAITACRLLTWAALSSEANSTASLAARTTASSRAAIDATQMRPDGEAKWPMKREEPFAQRRTSPRPTAQVSTSDRSTLNEVIRPVERRPDPRQATPPQEPFGALIGALINWSRLPNVTLNSATKPATSERLSDDKGSWPNSLGVAEAQQSPLSTRRPENSSAIDEEAARASYLSAGMSMMSGIVPNTLWCGLGDRASNYSELGPEFMLDACCRAHDHCPIRLKPFTADYGLINWSMSTRSHCDCDLDFNECLTSVNSTLSNVIKTLYFRFIGLQCIDLSNASQRPPSSLEGSEERV